ncbi:amino acid transporter [Pararhodobacter sp.]|uniref:amino acid transporter n=1 Tax=Pararhodobacter sp. TaxID=2127056 RepID=UPI002FDE6294
MNPLPEDCWNAWSPDELHARLGHWKSEWYVVGGWALDLWHDHQTRAHEDLEFAVLPAGIEGCRQILSELDFFEVREGRLSHLAANATPAAGLWQLWGADMAAGFWRVDMMVERGTPEVWAYKRDQAIRMPRTVAVRRNKAGIPYLAPANVLLFKAKHRREKDERDFEAALPKLNSREKLDLRLWLEALHPGHEWIARL